MERVIFHSCFSYGEWGFRAPAQGFILPRLFTFFVPIMIGM